MEEKIMTRPKADPPQGAHDLLIIMTKAGREQFTAEEESWDRLALAIAKVRRAV
jgi:hypothetical protein